MRPLTPGAPARLALGVAFFVVFVAGWSLATFGGFVSQDLPRRSGVDGALGLRAARDPGLRLGHRLDGVARPSAASSSPPCSSLPLGVAMGAYKPVEAFFEPFVSFARYLPASAFIPLLILWAGIGEAQKLALIFIGSFFQLVLMIAVIVGNTRRDLVEAAYTLGVGDRSLIRRVLLPGAAPEIAEVLRMVLGWAWTYVIVAELIGASSGIGHMITDSQALLATDQIIFGIIVIGVIGLVERRPVEVDQPAPVPVGAAPLTGAARWRTPPRRATAGAAAPSTSAHRSCCRPHRPAPRRAARPRGARRGGQLLGLPLPPPLSRLDGRDARRLPAPAPRRERRAAPRDAAGLVGARDRARGGLRFRRGVRARLQGALRCFAERLARSAHERRGEQFRSGDEQPRSGGRGPRLRSWVPRNPLDRGPDHECFRLADRHAAHAGGLLPLHRAVGPPVGRFWMDRVAPWMAENDLFNRVRYGIAHDDPTIATRRHAATTPASWPSRPRCPRAGRCAPCLRAVAARRVRRNGRRHRCRLERLLPGWLPARPQLDAGPLLERYPVDAENDRDRASQRHICIREPL